MSAIYGCEVKIIGRSAGRSIISAAAYRAGIKLFDTRQGIEHDFSRKADVVYSEIILPTNAPGWMRDRQALWGSLEERERRKDSQLARELILTLPRGLSPADRKALVREFAAQNFVQHGMLVDISIHCPNAADGQPQPHCHMLIAMRDINQDGWGLKRRDWNPQFSSARRSKGFVSHPEKLVDFRAMWALAVNTALDRSGIGNRVDHRSLSTQLEEKIAIATDKTLSIDRRLLAAKEAINLDRIPQPKSGIAREIAKRTGAENASNREKKAQTESEERQRARENWFFWLKRKLLREAQVTARLAAQQALYRIKLQALLLRQQLDERLALARYSGSISVELHRRRQKTDIGFEMADQKTPIRPANPEPTF